MLARHFLGEFTRSTGKPVALDPAVLTVLEDYPFPGNVRELRNLVMRLVALARDGRIAVADLPEYVSGERTVSMDKDPLRRFLRTVPRSNEDLKAARTAMQAILDGYVTRFEGRFLESLLEQAGGSVSRAAELAGMNRTLFHRKLKAAREGGEKG